MHEAQSRQLIDGSLSRSRAQSQAIDHRALRWPASAVVVGQAQHQQQHAQRSRAEIVEHAAIDQVIRQPRKPAPRGR
jgi:hypothetical protein